MIASTIPSHVRSWIPPSFTWATPSDVFALEVDIDDPDVVAFVGEGSVATEIIAPKKHALAIAAVVGLDSLRGQLGAAVWHPKLLKPLGVVLRKGVHVPAHCHGVFCLPDSKSVLVLVGRNAPPNLEGWVPPALRSEANALHKAHLIEVAEFEERIRLKRESDKELVKAHPEMGRWLDVGGGYLAFAEFNQRPKLLAKQLFSVMPKAVLVRRPSKIGTNALNRRVAVAIEESGWRSSRDGTYEGIQALRVGRNNFSLVSWEPYQGLPAYPEIRWAVQRRLPNAIRSPRALQPSRPEFESGLRSMSETASVHGNAADDTDLVHAVDDIQLDQRDFNDRVDESKKGASDQGFEAIAWFQAYHIWSDDTWGIYIDAQKLDNLALSLLSDFRTHHVQSGSHSLAALLAFGLTYSHEMFHAKVEGVLSWMEINAGRPRHLRYKKRVYDALRETPEWLEEALANWSSWSWFQGAAIQAHIARHIPAPDALSRLVEATLDLAPPGYRDWRKGHNLATWRELSTQLSNASPKLSSFGMGLPLDSVFNGPLPYDLRPSDIPLHFVGNGAIADRVMANPANFNVPTRREIERALKYFSHILDASGGKGGHQKWTGPDQRAFILPTRDPVSVGVFKTFLQHLGINKAIYVREVRPNL